MYISVITELELLAYKNITVNDEKIITEFISQYKVININSTIKKDTIRIRKIYQTKLPDSIIIATALYLDLPLITTDIDFKKVKELTLIQYEN